MEEGEMGFAEETKEERREERKEDRRDERREEEREAVNNIHVPREWLYTKVILSV